jgi:hypothetical protein
MGGMGSHPLASPMSSYYGASMSGMGLGITFCPFQCEATRVCTYY